MCSVQDGDAPLEKRTIDKRLGRVCMKCKEEQAILITRVNDAFCRACFQVYVTHKFRATIGKTKLVRDGELVLVAYSGGPSSSALLHLIQEGLSQRAHKKLRFKPGIIFIDEGATIGLPPEERLSNCEKLYDIMKKTGFPFYIKSLEEGLDLDKLSDQSPTNDSLPQSADTGQVTGLATPLADCDTDSVCSQSTASVTLPDLSPSTSPAFREESSSAGSVPLDGAQSKLRLFDEAGMRLKDALKSMKSVTVKEDFIRSLRHRIIQEVARNCGYSKVMLGNCGTQLAVRLLSDISCGRGAHAAMETSFADRRCDDLMFLRPLRDFSAKEVAMYNNMHRVETVFIPTITTKGDVGVSIEHLTEHFVTGLQAEYPSTVSNIMRTGEKLDAGAGKRIDTHCAMCQGPLDTSVGASSALSAVEFSQKMSREKESCFKGDHSVTKVECCGEGDGSCHSSAGNTRPSPQEILNNLCYACRLVVREMDDVYRLPEYVIKDVSWRGRRMKMKEDIQEFLLEES